MPTHFPGNHRRNPVDTLACQGSAQRPNEAQHAVERGDVFSDAGSHARFVSAAAFDGPISGTSQNAILANKIAPESQPKQVILRGHRLWPDCSATAQVAESKPLRMEWKCAAAIGQTGEAPNNDDAGMIQPGNAFSRGMIGGDDTGIVRLGTGLRIAAGSCAHA